MSQFTDAEIDALQRVHREFFVIAGGWAARLLRAHPLAANTPFEAIFTNDLDVAAPDKSPRKSSEVADALAREGFAADYAMTEERPPITSYQFGNFELEFIAPDLPRRVRSVTVDFLGVSAQKALDVELLLIEPVRIAFPELGTELVITNPASFILQRLLTLPARRNKEKKGKDTLYLHDALLLFTHGGRVHPEVCAQATRVISTMSKDQKSRSERIRVELESAANPHIREAARQAADTGRAGPNSPEAIALVIRLGLAELWPRT